MRLADSVWHRTCPKHRCEVKDRNCSLMGHKTGDGGCATRGKRCYECSPAKRSEIPSFQSVGSRRRLVRSLADHSNAYEGGLMVTLTYGRVFPDPRTAKDQLDTLFKRMRRAWPSVYCHWSLEVQKRQASHFGLPVGGVPVGRRREFRRWLRSNWLDISGSGGSSRRARERRAVDVARLYEVAGVIGYLAKEMGKVAQKQFADPDTKPGRWWGVHNRAAMPEKVQPVVMDGISWVTMLRRFLRLAALWPGLVRSWRQDGEWQRSLRWWWLGDAAVWLVWGLEDALARAGPRRSGADLRGREAV